MGRGREVRGGTELRVDMRRSMEEGGRGGWTRRLVLTEL